MDHLTHYSQETSSKSQEFPPKAIYPFLCSITKERFDSGLKEGLGWWVKDLNVMCLHSISSVTGPLRLKTASFRLLEFMPSERKKVLEAVLNFF